MKSFLPFIVIGVCIGMYFLYLSPTWTQISVLQAKKAEYINTLNDIKNLTNIRDSAISAYNSIPQDDIDKLSKIIPAKFDSAAFTNNISTLAARYNLVTKEVKTDEQTTAARDAAGNPTPDQGPFQTIKVSTKIDGTFDNFLLFLKDLESSVQLMDVVKLNVDVQKGKTPAQDTLEFSLVINTYALK